VHGNVPAATRACRPSVTPPTFRTSRSDTSVRTANGAAPARDEDALDRSDRLRPATAVPEANENRRRRDVAHRQVREGDVFERAAVNRLEREPEVNAFLESQRAGSLDSARFDQEVLHSGGAFRLHEAPLSRRELPDKEHVRIRQVVPESVPKRDPKPVSRQPTPTELPIKDGPEISDFRPVL
jgi:hypothetical protein